MKAIHGIDIDIMFGSFDKTITVGYKPRSIYTKDNRLANNGLTKNETYSRSERINSAVLTLDMSQEGPEKRGARKSIITNKGVNELIARCKPRSRC